MSKANTLNNDCVKSHDHVDFLIVTALEKERNAVWRQLDNHQEDRKCNDSTYHRATLKTSLGFDRETYEVALIVLKAVGNVDAALDTAEWIRHLNPRCVLMVGIAGGVRGEVSLGDVVVSSQIIYYEYAKETPSGSDQHIKVKSANSPLLKRLKNCDTKWHTLIQEKHPTNPRSTAAPQVHFGPIACGEKVIADAERVSKLKQLESKILAIEMESYGVAAAVADSDNSPRFIAIRGICDYADDQKDDDWQEYAADSAAAYTVGHLRSGVLSFPDDTQLLTRKTLVAIRHQSMEPLESRLNTASLPGTLKSANVEEIVIDQTDLYDNGRLTNPMEAARRQKDIAHQLSEALNTYPDAEIGYYGIAHIPLLFHIGCQLQNRKRLYFFDHNRKTDEWDQLQRGGDYPEIRLAGLPDVVNQQGGDVIVRISISYSVTLEAIEGIVTNPIASLHLRIDLPKIDVVASMEQLQQYSRAFRDMLDEIHYKLPNTERVHIFYAGPVPLAVYFGRQISKTIHPRIIVYNHSSKNAPRYAWGLEVTADVNSPDFMIRTGG